MFLLGTAALISFNVHKTKQVHAEKFIIKTKTYARHEFCSELIPSACPEGIPLGSAWLAGVHCVF
jgi:hypothetical protein